MKRDTWNALPMERTSTLAMQHIRNKFPQKDTCHETQDMMASTSYDASPLSDASWEKRQMRLSKTSSSADRDTTGTDKLSKLTKVAKVPVAIVPASAILEEATKEVKVDSPLSSNHRRPRSITVTGSTVTAQALRVSNTSSGHRKTRTRRNSDSDGDIPLLPLFVLFFFFLLRAIAF